MSPISHMKFAHKVTIGLPVGRWNLGGKNKNIWKLSDWFNFFWTSLIKLIPAMISNIGVQQTEQFQN